MNHNGSNRGSRLHYYGTSIDVQPGDKILWKRLFRRAIKATVVYIPGLCPPHPDLQHEWAFQIEDGTILQMVYCPERSQPKSNIKFVERGEAKPLNPDMRIY